VTIAVAQEDPLGPEARALLERHLAFARLTSPPEHVHALCLDGVLDPSVTLFGARHPGGPLLGVGALRHLDDTHGEVKAMHTAAESRGRGVGRAVVVHLLGVARDRAYRRVSLETGTDEAFAPARALYSAVGFSRCPPFGEYTDNPYSLCMTISLESAESLRPR
jgi:putative acetyltransferase